MGSNAKWELFIKAKLRDYFCYELILLELKICLNRFLNLTRI